MQQDDTSAQALVDQGLAFHRANDTVNALACYEQALVADPAHADALNLVALARLSIDDLDGALHACERALAVRSDIAQFHVTLGKVQMQRLEMHAAVAAFEAAIACDPRLVEAHNDLGNARLAGGDPDGAIAAYEAALTVDATYDLARGNLANTLYEQGRYREAERAFRHLLDAHPGSVDLLATLALVVGAGGRHEEAVELCVRGRIKRPDDPLLVQRLLYYAALCDRFAEHLAALHILDDEARAQLAEALATQGRTAEAVACRPAG